ncbi:MAG: cupin domain-containing protein [Pyrinomonadaceae bacterium]
MKRLKHTLLTILLSVVAYVVIGVAIDYAFPEKIPDPATYFQPGDVLHSRNEGFDQTILSVKDGWVHSSLIVQPYAPGPPEHIHTNLVETFAVKEGVLSILLNGEKKTVRAGESLTIPVGTAHRPFNETGRPVIVESDGIENSLTVEFAYYLSQIYGFGDGLGEQPDALSMIMQLSVYGNKMDAYLADGPPVPVQKAMRVVLAPTARLLGYRAYYPEYRIVHNQPNS